MYKLPFDQDKLQAFSEKEGYTCAKSLTIEDRKGLNITCTAKNYFKTYEENSKEQGSPFCDNLEEGRELFVHFFGKGFVSFQDIKEEKFWEDMDEKERDRACENNDNFNFSWSELTDYQKNILRRRFMNKEELKNVKVI